MFFKITSLAAALALLNSNANAHLIMKSPVPYGADSIDNSPLTGSNYPCKNTGQASFYSTEGIDNTMAIGEPQTLSFEGSAVHGGGSCQLALTDDMQPSESTSWQVILSIEGGCPSKNGQGVSDYEFTIPDSIAPGQYSFAWTWISKLSGTQEYYMNCAPVTVTGGSAKRSADLNEYESTVTPRQAGLPELFVANLDGINSCKTTLSTDPKFPVPGDNVESFGTPEYGEVTGSNCVPKGQTEGPGGGNGGNDGGEAGPSTSSQPAAPSTSAAPTQTPTPTTFKTSTTPPATSQPATPTGGGSSGALSGTCSEEGMFNCDGTSYQQCAAGSWTGMSALPGGTTCIQGQSTSLWK